MLSLYTGLPGHGKTLNAIYDIRDEYPDRDIYVNGIPELRLPWIPLETPEEWFKLPDGSVIVIDEAQRIFPVRGASAPVPERCSQFETHRHRGFDIILITQDARLLDVHVRRLVGRHRHVQRQWGMERCTIFEWESVNDPSDWHARKAALRNESRKYPSEVYELYKSATLHTVKRKLPKKLLLIPTFLALVLFAVYTVIDTLFLSSPAAEALRERERNKVVEEAPDSGFGHFQPVKEVQRPEGLDFPTPEQYAMQHTPRFVGLDFTAPIFDEVRQAETFPRPNCMILGPKCRCYTQQATRMSVPEAECRRMVEQGYFDYTRADPENEGDGRSNRQIAADYVLSQLLDDRFGTVRQHLESGTMASPAMPIDSNQPPVQ